mmetsp:Transcript_23650/g.33041  ORF Transcript_23650/g.33041 Transcript_23650/m.33041 type:complete len:202 (+) Transcript_23650:195-800(+)
MTNTLPKLKVKQLPRSPQQKMVAQSRHDLYWEGPVQISAWFSEKPLEINVDSLTTILQLKRKMEQTRAILDERFTPRLVFSPKEFRLLAPSASSRALSDSKTLGYYHLHENCKLVFEKVMSLEIKTYWKKKAITLSVGPSTTARTIKKRLAQIRALEDDMLGLHYDPESEYLMFRGKEIRDSETFSSLNLTEFDHIFLREQ